ILVNKAECEALGMDPEALLGKDDYQLSDAETAQRAREGDLKVIRSLKPLSPMETEIQDKEGQSTNHLVSKIPLFDLSGKINGIIGIGMDITALKKDRKSTRLNSSHV